MVPAPWGRDGVQGGAGPPRWAVRCLSSVSLLSVEDTGRGSMHDWGLAKQAGPCRLAHVGGGLWAWPAGGFSALALILNRCSRKP